MRLLNVDTFKLEDFFYVDPPPYAILSHTWGSDSEEVSYSDVLNGRLDSEATRPPKVSGCCATAKADGYQYVWIDTCCIDKTNSVELQEAINSMFQWYRDANICYAYLSDVPSGVSEDETRAAFSSSRWFTRGWTLQELLAPLNMRFYSRDWEVIGTKGQLCNLVEEITGIPTMYLIGVSDLHEASVAQRMSWAAKRVTKRQEDIAYCLLGIFGVSMPMIYGEKEKAFRRLQDQIMKETGDDSIFAWDLDLDEQTPKVIPTPVPGALLAPLPSSFANCGNIRSVEHPSPLELQGGAIRLPLTVHTEPGGAMVGFLRCFHETRGELTVVAVPLVPAPGVGRGYFRDISRRARLVQIPNYDPSPPLIHLHLDAKHTVNPQISQASWYHIQNSVVGLELIAVDPASCWHKERSLIEVPRQGTTSSLRQVLGRFRTKSNDAKDFVLVLDLSNNRRCGLMVADRETTLEEMTKYYSDWWGHTRGEACIGSESVAVSIRGVRGSKSQSRFVVGLRRADTGNPCTFDATTHLQGIEAKLLLEEIEHGVEKTSKAEDLRREKRDAQSCLAACQTEIEHVRREIERLRKRESALLEQCQIMERDVMELDHQLTRAGADESKREKTISNLNQIIHSCLGNGDEDKENDNRNQVNDEEKEGTDQALAESVKRKLFQMARDKGYSALARHLVEMLIIGKQDPGVALRAAAQNGYVDLVQSLLDRGVDINGADENGRTALHQASRNGHENIVDLLLRRGANPRRRDRENKRPSDSAHTTPEVITLLYKAMFLNGKVKTKREKQRARRLDKAAEKANREENGSVTDEDHAELLKEMVDCRDKRQGLEQSHANLSRENREYQFIIEVGRSKGTQQRPSFLALGEELRREEEETHNMLQKVIFREKLLKQIAESLSISSSGLVETRAVSKAPGYDDLPPVPELPVATYKERTAELDWDVAGEPSRLRHLNWHKRFTVADLFRSRR
ncbi:hypothetical protein VTJ04DRAFT_988 [Mycothermus thermophilus]|uniref:uncharacterized protein n=1 Tax=Humicola insolens TaxID=85995 RepID=UPI0037448B99